jgi:hypothetical protein
LRGDRRSQTYSFETDREKDNHMNQEDRLLGLHEMMKIATKTDALEHF